MTVHVEVINFNLYIDSSNNLESRSLDVVVGLSLFPLNPEKAGSDDPRLLAVNGLFAAVLSGAVAHSFSHPSLETCENFSGFFLLLEAYIANRCVNCVEKYENYLVSNSFTLFGIPVPGLISACK